MTEKEIDNLVYQTIRVLSIIALISLFFIDWRIGLIIAVNRAHDGERIYRRIRNIK